MSNGSKEQEFPVEDYENAIDGVGSLAYDWKNKPHKIALGLIRQLREALAQIAALKAQVELNPKTFPEACALYEKILGEKFALERSLFAMKVRAEKAEADLAALREDKLRLDWLDEVRPSLIPHKERFGGDGWSYWWSVVKNKRAMGHPLGYVRHIIDQARRERKTSHILDTTGGEEVK